VRGWRRGVARLVAGALVAGCSGDVVDVSVALTLDGQGSCPQVDPGVSWLPCGGQVGVWLLGADERVIDERCVPFAEVPLTVAGLPEILAEVGFGGLAAGDQVAVEIAVYSGAAVDCPRFDPDLPQIFPFYYGRSEVTELAGSDTQLTVPLSCFELVTEPCSDAWLEVTATVADLDSWELLVEPGVMSVTAGVVTREGNYAEGGSLTSQGVEWVGQIAAVEVADQCLGVVATPAESFRSFLSCESLVEPGRVTAQGYSVPAYLIDTISFALGEEPPSGWAIGRVVDFEGQPVAGVEILPAEPDLSIRYLSSDLTTFDGVATAEHGYFAILPSAPGCCFDLPEVLPLGPVEVAPFGVVPGLVTVVPVRVPR
jgi:hypothetical protein